MFTNPFKKKRSIRFHTLHPGANTFYPIINSSKLNRNWVQEEKEDYKKRSKCPFAFGEPPPHSINKCPAIHMIMNQGYIIKTAVDINVTRVDDKLEVQASNLIPHLPSVVTHGEEVSKWLLDSSKDNTAPEILKVNTPWRVTTNDNDLIFLVVKVPHTKEDRFSAVMGVMDPKTAFEINVQLLWHLPKNESSTIKAGTPLCMYIPMSRQYLNTSFVCEDADERDWNVEKEMTYSYSHVNQSTNTLGDRVSRVVKILKKYYD